MTRFKPSQIAVATLMAIACLLSPKPAQAMSRDVKSVIVAGTYGLVGGTAIGLATLPFSQDLRSVFIGSSLGLYLGIAIGFYFITHRDDPSNPLRSRRDRQWDESKLDPVDRERELRLEPVLQAQPSLARSNEQPVSLDLPVLSF